MGFMEFRVHQDPPPGTRMVKHRGDTITFHLTLSEFCKGSAFLRTNIGHAEIAREEIIQFVECDKPPLEQDWFDVPMVPQDELHFKITLPLCDVGHFEAKAFFLPADQRVPVWVPGANTAVNVSPAGTCCANIIYNAFVRQFGPNKNGRSFDDSQSPLVQPLDAAGYTVIPPSGTFRDLIRELDFIIGKLGCRIIQLLPINPTPTTYGRMGRFGSPYAALSFTAVDPALAEFDPKATPLEQFIELVDAVHARQAKIVIDIAINHTGWAAHIHETNPQWLIRDKDGQIEVPGAWGVRWEDLTKLDYSYKDLWQYVVDVFLTWCRRGVDGFRCDAGYMIPLAVWEYIIAAIRDQFPDTLFFLEGLGGKISVTRDLLNVANFNWAYSELFQNYDRPQIESYLPQAIEIAGTDGVLVHYAETHDNNRLASRSQIFAKMRTALCALASFQGAFGFANGVEWYAEEKINVHESPSLNWGSAINQVKEIRRLNTILKYHPAFHDRTELNLIQHGEGNCIALLRHHLPSGKRLLVVANLDDRHAAESAWDMKAAQLGGTKLFDLLTKKQVFVNQTGKRCLLPLNPGQVVCLTTDPTELESLQEDAVPHAFERPPRITLQMQRAKALDVFQFYNGSGDIGDFNPDHAAQDLIRDPVEYCRCLNPQGEESRVIKWKLRRDTKREVMIPPGHFLMVMAARPFRARIVNDSRVLKNEDSIEGADGSHFALLTPLPVPETHVQVTIQIVIYGREHARHLDAPLLLLGRGDSLQLKTVFRRNEIQDANLCLLMTNDSGATLKLPVKWGKLTSRYDALLAANLDPAIPVERWIMLTRCRIWVVYQDYSQEISNDCLECFSYDLNLEESWRFRIPVGRGAHVSVTLKLEIFPGRNALRMTISRPQTSKAGQELDVHETVRVIVRPDIENRNFHETTKAYTGPEIDWPPAVSPYDHGFTFQPDRDHLLDVRISEGTFVSEPEWIYMVHRAKEAERGLDPDSDLFSPGYFLTSLRGAKTVSMDALVRYASKPRTSTELTNDQPSLPKKSDYEQPSDWLSTLKAALNQFVVKRGTLKTVIAGYPWFLDWGRDSLIVARGLIASGRTQVVREILQQFGRFEDKGTLPNMIQGDVAANRDTTDAPLWFCIVCKELLSAEGQTEFLDKACGNRTIRQVLLSIASNYIKGTPNGIQMDFDSGLIFSPAHFTWMDTNHPAGTPREGYPIEIQALWAMTLEFLANVDTEGTQDWKGLADRVRRSVHDLFYLAENGYLADCLHTSSDINPRRADVDDALRPNQLLAITLGVVSDIDICRDIVTACEQLIVPGAIRSLADRPVRRPLEIIHQGKIINNPIQPYVGKYVGDEDTQRKPAYHNGTAWTWLFPSFCEAWVCAYGDGAKETAGAWLSSSIRLINSGCIGHIPEILDGDFPHTQRGCDAQAWGLSEWLRVWIRLKNLTSKR